MRRLLMVGFKLLVIMLTSLYIHSCASNGFLMAKAKVKMYQTAYPAKSDTATIDIYRSNRPDQKYLELAEISCGDTNDDWSMKQITIKAREIGADGLIIMGKAGSYGYGVPIGDMVYTSTESYGITAIAIKYIIE